MHVIKEKQLQLTTDNHHPITLVIILNIPRFLMTILQTAKTIKNRN